MLFYKRPQKSEMIGIASALDYFYVPYKFPMGSWSVIGGSTLCQGKR